MGSFLILSVGGVRINRILDSELWLHFRYLFSLFRTEKFVSSELINIRCLKLNFYIYWKLAEPSIIKYSQQQQQTLITIKKNWFMRGNAGTRGKNGENSVFVFYNENQSKCTQNINEAFMGWNQEKLLTSPDSNVQFAILSFHICFQK